MILRKLNYWIESKRIHDAPHWRLLVLFKDTIYFPVHFLCMIKPFRTFFFRYFGTTGRYEPFNRAIVSHTHRFVYFYIPKVASTSLKQSLTRSLYQRSVRARVHTFWFEEAIDIKKGDYDQYFKFALVRNPWDRLVSCYSDKILSENVTNYKYKNGVFRRYVKNYKNLFYRGMPFDEFVRVISSIPDEKADRHFRSQISFITDRSNTILLDFIGKFESLDADMRVISKHTGIKMLHDVHENQSKRPRDYRTLYTDETRDLVAKRYQQDIQAFGYSF